jgi:hypothetical protein
LEARLNESERGQRRVRRALTSGHFVWSYAGFALALDAAQNGLNSWPLNGVSARFSLFRAASKKRLCGRRHLGV